MEHPDAGIHADRKRLAEEVASTKRRLWSEIKRNEHLKNWVESDPIFRKLLADMCEVFEIESVEMKENR